MNLLVPGALGLAALAGPLLVLYMLRSRRRQVAVSSTLLWSRAEQNVTSAVPWKRLDLTTLLLLQLLLLALFVLSLARPFFTEPTVLGPHTVFVVDTSGSMAQAGRFEEAVGRIEELAVDVSDAKVVSIVEAGPEARVVSAFVRDPDLVVDALTRLAPTGGEADLSGAIRLARGLATPDRPTNLVLLTDGGSRDLAEEPVVDAVHVRIDAVEPNVGIAAFTVDDSPNAGTRAFLSVANRTEETRTVEFDVAVDGLLVSTVEVEVGPGATADRTFSVDAAPGSVVEVVRSGPEDGLALDDRAWVVLGEPEQRRVAVTGEGSPFLAALIGVTEGFETADRSAADVVVVDRGPLPTLDRPTWLIRPDEPPPGIRITGLVENAVATFQAPGEPLLDNVDLSGLAVAEAQVVEATGWFAIARAGDVPLILLGDVDGHRSVYFTFDITHSNLPVQLSFPILGSALLEWLGGVTAEASVSAPAGTPIPLAAPPGTSIDVLMPDGEIRRVDATATSFVDTGTPGVYRIGYTAADGVASSGPVAARSFVAEEARAAPRTIATSTGGEQAGNDAGRLIREFAPQFIVVVLALLMVEWWLGHQRPVPMRRTT